MTETSPNGAFRGNLGFRKEVGKRLEKVGTLLAFSGMDSEGSWDF
jgi:hypothetical protein